MIYLSAGHHFDENGADPGAIGVGGVKEANLAIEIRDLIAEQLTVLGAKFICDHETETLSEYLRRIKPGSGSVVCELHFNSAANLATGFEVILRNDCTADEKKIGNEMCLAATAVMGLFNRGVKTEAQSHRGRLGILHTAAGISILPEICFINNPVDLDKYHANKVLLAKKIAALLKKYDDMYN